jgi:hypothetical protein
MVIGREYGDPVLFDDMPGLEIRDGHSHSQPSGLIAAGNDASVIIAEHDDGLLPEVRAEDPLAGAIETITVDDGDHKLWMT